MKKIVALILMVSLLLPAFGQDDGVQSLSFGFEDMLSSPLYSPSYSGRYVDSMLNPAMLSKRSDDGIFFFTTTLSDAYDKSVFSEDMPYIQNFKSEMTFSFISRYVSLTVLTNTYFRNRSERSGYLESDIFNTLMMQIDASYSFPYVSLGMRIRGGNRLVREDRALTGFFSAMGEAYFSPFSVMPTSEFLSIGAFLNFEYSFFSLSFSIADIVTLRFPENMSSPYVYVGADAVLDSMDISFAFSYPRYNGRGELNFIRPRMSYTMHGNLGGKYDIYLVSSLDFQLLPTMTFSLAVGYKEVDHRFFSYDGKNGTLMFALEFFDRFYSIALGFNVDTATFSRYYPSITFSLIR